jgi:hypothetical protein
MIFLINDDVAGLILRVKGMGDLYFIFRRCYHRIGVEKSGYFFELHTLLRAPSKPTPTLKNLVNPVNPDSKT